MLAIATSVAEPPDRRLPVEGEAAWDPADPLFLQWGSGDALATDTSTFRRGVSLVDADGAEVDAWIVDAREGRVLLRPKGGLAADATYTWRVDDFGDAEPHEARVPSFQLPGTWSFRTAPDGGTPPADAAECADQADRIEAIEVCGDQARWDHDCDTGDSG